MNSRPESSYNLPGQVDARGFQDCRAERGAGRNGADVFRCNRQVSVACGSVSQSGWRGQGPGGNVG